MLEVVESPSLFFRGMAGSRISVAIAHGEGRAEFTNATDQAAASTALRYVQADGGPATAYPANPNGSAAALAGLPRQAGRATTLVPPPERPPLKATLAGEPGIGQESGRLSRCTSV